MLLQLMHDIIGNSVTFFFGQFLAKSAHQFARASQRECNGEAQQVSTGTHVPLEQIENTIVNWTNATIICAVR